MSERPESKARPLSPRLSVYRWHPAMIASIAHRGSGLVLVLFVPLYLWLLHGMTGSAAEYTAIVGWMHSGLGRFALWLAGTSLIYHLCNGLRFIAMDAGWLDSRSEMLISARVVLVVALLAASVLAVLL